MKRAILSVVAVGALTGAAVMLRAQDPVKVDAKHYTVAFENDQVRVLKAHYGPGEKSEMHSHPNSVAVFLTDAKGSSPSRTARARSSTGKPVMSSGIRPRFICRRTPATRTSMWSWSN